MSIYAELQTDGTRNLQTSFQPNHVKNKTTNRSKVPKLRKFNDEGGQYFIPFSFRGELPTLAPAFRADTAFLSKERGRRRNTHDAHLVRESEESKKRGQEPPVRPRAQEQKEAEDTRQRKEKAESLQVGER